MLKAIILFSIRNKLIVGLFLLGLVSLGIYDFTRLPIDAVPDITNNQVQVITVSPSLAAPEVERLITFPVEQSMANIPGITEMRSFSRFGLSLVTIVFNDATNVYWARQQVSERLVQIRSLIPADAGNPEMGPVSTGLGEIYQYAVKPKKGYESEYSPAELRTIQDWIIRRQLLGTRGVADVSSFGGYLKQYEVAVDPNRLKSMEISITDVFRALEKNNQNTGGTYIEKGPNILFIRSEGLAKTTEDIGSILVKRTEKGIPVFVRDIAEVRIGHAPRYGAMVYNDQMEVAGAVVMMLKGENSSKVIRAVKEKMKEIEKTLPEGVTVEPFLDRTKMVNNAIHTVKQNLLEGALIVILILVLFLGNLRAGFIVASVIPLSMLFAVIMMNLFKVSGNLMSLGALDFGLIVDGAVIIVEAVMFRLYHSKSFKYIDRFSQEQIDTEVGDAASRMMNAAIFGQIIILIVYLPILSLVGIEGKMFRPMAQTVSFALIGASILSLTYVPMVTSLILSKKIKQGETWSDKIMRWLEKIYAPVLARAMAWPKTMVVLSLVFFAGSVVVLARMGGEFIPELEEGDFAVDTRLLTGSSLSATIEQTRMAAGILIKKFPEVEKVVTKIGAGEIPTDPMPVEASDMMVILKDKKEWTSAKGFEELANKMSQALQEIPGVATGFQYPVQMRFNELMTGARQDVVCKIFGENLDSLAFCAGRLREIVNSVSGAKDIYVETVTGLPQIVVQYNREAISRFGMNIQDLNQVVRSAFAGEKAGIIYENERRFDLVVRLGEEGRRDVEDVRNLLVTTPSGIQIPLYQVAHVQIQEGPNQIQREDAKRRIVVGFNVRGRDVESLVKELQTKVNKRLKLPVGYYITYGGQFKNLVEARQRLMIAVPVALLLILLMLYFAFGSLKDGLLIFSAIPLSAIGGVLMLWLRDMPFSVSAGVGFIALFGVAVLNGIVLITEFKRLGQQGITDPKTIVMEGTRQRLRPVLMTASVASLGFLPMALSHGAGAEVQRPLASVVIGGLITATLLTLLVLPVLYAWLIKPRSGKFKELSIITLLLFVSFPGIAQFSSEKRITIDSMMAIAERRNLTLQTSRAYEQYWSLLGDKTFELPRTLFGFEYGNINSPNNDTRYLVNQTFLMPNVYRRQKDWYQTNAKASVEYSRFRWQEIQREVRNNFYDMVDLLERERLITRLDSVYIRFEQAAELRFKTGETGILEKSNASLQIASLRLQRQQLIADLKILQKQQHWLLNEQEAALPQYDSLTAEVILLTDTSVIREHPLIKYLQLQSNVFHAQTELERNRLSPEFTLGYSNLSLIGYQTLDGVNQKYYSSSDRFNIFNFSLGLPIFNSASRERIKAGKLNEQISRIQTENSGLQLRTQLSQTLDQYQKQKAAVDFYRKSGLVQSDLIIRNANLGFEKGDISYVEWTTLMNQAVEIQLNYLESLRQLNKAAIDIMYLTGK